MTVREFRENHRGVSELCETYYIILQKSRSIKVEDTILSKSIERELTVELYGDSEILKFFVNTYMGELKTTLIIYQQDKLDVDTEELKNGSVGYKYTSYQSVRSNSMKLLNAHTGSSEL